jgi:hypothetical protein
MFWHLLIMVVTDLYGPHLQSHRVRYRNRESNIHGESRWNREVGENVVHILWAHRE